jgi:hypothetical protein
MAVDERSRRALFQRLAEVLGHEEASTLMEHLPPVGWGDVATRRDLDALAGATKRDLDVLAERNEFEHQALRKEMDARFEQNRLEHEALEHRLTATFHRELAAQTRTYLFATVGAVISVGGLAVAAARF